MRSASRALARQLASMGTSTSGAALEAAPAARAGAGPGRPPRSTGGARAASAHAQHNDDQGKPDG
jgi:hypothetical protein